VYGIRGFQSISQDNKLKWIRCVQVMLWTRVRTGVSSIGYWACLLAIAIFWKWLRAREKKVARTHRNLCKDLWWTLGRAYSLFRMIGLWTEVLQRCCAYELCLENEKEKEKTKRSDYQGMYTRFLVVKYLWWRSACPGPSKSIQQETYPA
jgi:hypothetical protein